MNPPQALPSLQLRDIHLPEPISWWPPAPGWWLLLALIALAVLTLLLSRKLRARRRLEAELRSEIEQELAGIRQRYRENSNAVMLARDLSELLRRASISYYPMDHIAGLTGDDWLHFLSRTHARERPELSFRSAIARNLLVAPYMDDTAQIEQDSELLIKLCESWLLQSHKRPADLAPADKRLRVDAT